MKIGILTFHFCYNYGAVLQCVGLYQTLKRLGHDVDVVDFRPLREPSYRLWQGWGLRKEDPMLNISKRWIDLRYGGVMRERFNHFSSANMTLSRSCDGSTVGDVVRDYDALVVGSDQVWNRNFCHVLPPYFLQFPDDFQGRRVSYAACCGQKTMPPEGLDELALALKRFAFVSVRNKVTLEWVRELTGLTAEVVCDPTLLWDYTGVEATAALPYKRYILAYVLGQEISGGGEEAIAAIRKAHGDLPVIWICSSAHQPEQRCRWADHVAYTAGPAEWLQLMANAAFIYTDSFHGTVFAMKYRKPFFAYFREVMRSHRLTDIADRYGVGSVVASGLDDALARDCFRKELDYSAIEQRIAAHRALSLNFLGKALA